MPNKMNYLRQDSNSFIYYFPIENSTSLLPSKVDGIYILQTDFSTDEWIKKFSLDAEQAKNEETIFNGYSEIFDDMLYLLRP